MLSQDAYELCRIISQQLRKLTLELEDIKLHPDHCGGSCLMCKAEKERG